MNRVLIVAEHVDGKLNAAVAKCVACAAAIPDAEIAVAVLAKDGAAVAETLENAPTAMRAGRKKRRGRWIMGG